MKTRIVFEPSDFPGKGQLIIRQSADSSEQESFKASVAYKIGYILEGEKRPCKIALNDGMVTPYTDIEELCKCLNEDPIGYRPMTEDEIQEVSEYVGNRFQ